MFRAFVVIGVIVDLLITLILLIVVGWIVDSWHDRDPWAGPILTTLWSIALMFSAGAPMLAYSFRQRKAGPGKVALAVWLPAVLLVTICVVGFIISPL